MEPSSSNACDAPCSCGSGKKAGSCCRSGETCPCGSGKTAGECCYKQ